MNLTLSVVVLKTLIITGLTMLVLPLASSLTAIQSLLIGLVLSFLLYAGDVLILPRVSIATATAADAVIVVLAVWAGTNLLGGVGLNIPESFLLALAIGAWEWFLHRYLRVNVKVR